MFDSAPIDLSWHPGGPGLETRKRQFWARVEHRGPDECWPWKGSKRSNGYGRVMVSGHIVGAHRLAFVLTYGKEPENFVLHTCDHPKCCNPAHLYDGTPNDNMQDRKKRGRGKGARLQGQAHGRAKVTWQQVQAIRQSSDPVRILSRRYGLGHTQIRRIRNNEQWACPEARGVWAQ